MAPRGVRFSSLKTLALSCAGPILAPTGISPELFLDLSTYTRGKVTRLNDIIPQRLLNIYRVILNFDSAQFTSLYFQIS